MIIYYFYNSINNKKIYNDISESYHKDKKEGKPKDLSKINEDVLGWIEVPGTEIDYPVVQGEDNDFYLDHDIKKNKSIHGSIFMDYRNRLEKDQNLIIYGHHMKDGSMFKDLTRYKEEDFFSNNRDIYLDIEGERQKYKIFSLSVLRANVDYIKTSFHSKEEFLSYIEGIKKDAYLYRDFDFSGEEKILTLSTCSYEFKDARTVIHAVKN